MIFEGCDWGKARGRREEANEVGWARAIWFEKLVLLLVDFAHPTITPHLIIPSSPHIPLAEGVAESDSEVEENLWKNQLVMM